ncbi:anaerobic ribonucleoside-triphosphate reductase activating protein, partial [Thermodesulfobacteriota bacterium]
MTIRTSFVDWGAKITSIMFLPNCNFRCPYCHNAELINNPSSLQNFDLDEILTKLKGYEGWIDGICISGGEPTIHKDLPEFIRYIRANCPQMVKIDTNGTNPSMLQALIDEKLIEAVSMDVKAPLDDMRYYKAAGTSVDLSEIKKSIDILRDSGLDVEFRTTIHPDLFCKKDVEELCEQLKGAKQFKLQNFNIHAETLDPAYKGSEPFSEGEFEDLQKIAAEILGK